MAWDGDQELLFGNDVQLERVCACDYLINLAATKEP
jgi:hypothetical protein